MKKLAGMMQTKSKAFKIHSQLTTILTWVWLYSDFNTDKATKLVEKIDDVAFEIEKKYKLFKRPKKS